MPRGLRENFKGRAVWKCIQPVRAVRGRAGRRSRAGGRACRAQALPAGCARGRAGIVLAIALATSVAPVITAIIGTSVPS